MQAFPIGRYRFFQQLQINSILNKIVEDSTTGCLQVFSSSQSWLLYLENGKLVYACYTEKMFDLLYRKLNDIADQSTTLDSDIYRKIKTIFETASQGESAFNPDYLAICWLVSQNHITPTQADRLIKELVSEVIESLLRVKAGCYELTNETFIDDLPKFSNLDLQEVIYIGQNNIKTIAELQSRVYHKRERNHLNRDTNNIYLTRGNSGQSPKFTKSHDRKTYTIVSVDDSPTVTNIIKNFLDDNFFLVVGINDPLKALMQIVRTKPDLILLDVEMPNLGGYELCSLLRKHPSLSTTPIIMVTGHTNLIDRAKAKLVRSSGYLSKPFTQSSLLKIIFKNLIENEKV
jgi:two-component system, chemotaxis family, response regulator PixG